jgi:glutamyl-tRNA reductase
VIRFSVLQRPPNAAAFGADALVWRTCVRQVALVDESHPVPEEAAAWHGEGAYAHLLEVICGLHSPIVGETEVLHQFKVFAEGLTADHGRWRELCSSLLADARAVRARHLGSLGSRSYGSAVRRYVRQCRRVAIFGTGVLAQEILPYVTAGDRSTDVWGRRAACPFPAANIAYRSLTSIDGTAIADATAIVIAAPMTAREIAIAASAYLNPAVLIDLRAEGATDAAPPIAPIVTLADVFAGFQQAARVTDRRVAAAKAEIQRRAHRFATRAKCNPSGWHDLCA